MLRFRHIVIAAGLLALAAGCKPTEKGYRQAYDAAKAKREYVDPDADLLTGGHKLLDESATDWVALGSDTLQLRHLMISPEEGQSWPQAGPYRLAVAMMKMTTNSRSMLADISRKGHLKPVVATDGKGQHFIIAGSATYPDSLRQVLATFRTDNPGFRHIGLSPEVPVVIVSK